MNLYFNHHHSLFDNSYKYSIYTINLFIEAIENDVLMNFINNFKIKILNFITLYFIKNLVKFMNCFFNFKFN